MAVSFEKSMKKIEKIQIERALRFLYNDSNSSYDDLISQAGKCTMKIGRLRTLCIEIYKTVSKLNPPFMQDIFKLKQKQGQQEPQMNEFITDQARLLSGQRVTYR